MSSLAGRGLPACVANSRLFFVDISGQLGSPWCSDLSSFCLPSSPAHCPFRGQPQYHVHPWGPHILRACSSVRELRTVKKADVKTSFPHHAAQARLFWCDLAPGWLRVTQNAGRGAVLPVSELLLLVPGQSLGTRNGGAHTSPSHSSFFPLGSK